MANKLKQKSAYSVSEIKRIRQVAMKIAGAVSVSHIRPRCYCIAKPAVCCAVFVTPPVDAEQPLQNTQNASGEIVQDNSAINVKVGDWCALAYVCDWMGGGSTVIEILKPRK